MAKHTVTRNVRLGADTLEELAKAGAARGMSAHKLMVRVLEETADELARGRGLPSELEGAIIDMLLELGVSGQTANVTPEFMLNVEQRVSEKLGFDIDYEKIKKEREKQQKLMAQQAEAQRRANGQHRS